MLAKYLAPSKSIPDALLKAFAVFRMIKTLASRLYVNGTF